MQLPDKPLKFVSRAEWRAWLREHHADEPAAWLRLYKRKAAKEGLTLEAAVEEALCFGWIDGLLKRADPESYLLRFSPRKSRSIWSEINKRRAEKLIRQGRMTAAGLEKIAEAKANGEWEAATVREDVRRIPADLRRALKPYKTAWSMIQAWPMSRKKQYLHWLASAKTPATRQNRIRAIVDMVACPQEGAPSQSPIGARVSSRKPAR